MIYGDRVQRVSRPRIHYLEKRAAAAATSGSIKTGIDVIQGDVMNAIAFSGLPDCACIGGNIGNRDPGPAMAESVVADRNIGNFAY